MATSLPASRVLSRTYAEHQTGIVRGKETSSAYFHTLPCQVTRLVTDPRTDRIAVALAPDQKDPEPVAVADIIAQKQRRRVIVADKYIQGAIVIEVSNGEAAGGESPGKYRAALRAHVRYAFSSRWKSNSGSFHVTVAEVWSIRSSGNPLERIRSRSPSLS